MSVKIPIYTEGSGRTDYVYVTAEYGYLVDTTYQTHYLKIKTSLKDGAGDALPEFDIVTMTDSAPGYGVSTTWTDLINDYVEWYLTAAEVNQSSSSSSQSSSSSSSQSSSSSSSQSSSSSSSRSSSSET